MAMGNKRVFYNVVFHGVEPHGDVSLRIPVALLWKAGVVIRKSKRFVSFSVTAHECTKKQWDIAKANDEWSHSDFMMDELAKMNLSKELLFNKPSQI